MHSEMISDRMVNYVPDSTYILVIHDSHVGYTLYTMMTSHLLRYYLKVLCNIKIARMNYQMQHMLKNYSGAVTVHS